MSDLVEKYGVRGWLPEGHVGEWTVKHFAVSHEEADRERMRAAVRLSARHVPEGRYAALLHGSQLVMSDTPDEICDHLQFIHKATGEVLIHGLGLGMCAAAVLRKPEVRHVTVVEKAEEVISLVGHPLAEAMSMDGCPQSDNWYPYDQAPLQRDRLTIIHDDAMTWQPPTGSKWDVVWHDIWNNLCVDNLDEMKRLHRRFGRRTRVWQGSWGREFCEEEQRREKRQGWY